MNTDRSDSSSLPFFPSRIVALMALALCVVAAETQAQQSLVLSQVQLRYRVLRRATQLDDVKMTELKKIDATILGARDQGETGLLFRELHKGIALMENRAWTPENEFATSLSLTTGMTVSDPTRMFYAELGQLYPAKPASRKLMAYVHLGGPNQARREETKPLAVVSNVPPDLVYEPLRIAVDLSDVKDGNHQFIVELRDGTKTVARATTAIFLARGLDSRRAAIEQQLKKIDGFSDAKASIRYPFDFARVLNLGKMSAVNYSFDKAIDRSDELLASIASGKDPFAGATGIVQKHYNFEEAGEIMPYRLFVPKDYSAGKQWPLIIGLHGLGGTESTFLGLPSAPLPTAAAEHGYIVATPLGYRRNGGYGKVPPIATPDAETIRMVQLSEQDVMNVLRLVRQQYNIDSNRIYLMGHSMGGNGTWTIGSKYAEIWAAIAPIAGGSASPDTTPIQKLKDNNVPVMIVHGDADKTAPVEASRVMAAELKKLGVEHEYIEVKGAGHGDVVAPNVPKILNYFDAHRKGAK